MYAYVSGELWTERVMLYYVEDVPGAWSDSSNIKSVVVDENCGLIFETNAYDLNSDGMVFSTMTFDGCNSAQKSFWFFNAT